VSQPVTFGIVGCGIIGPHHARAIAGLDEARLVAVCDEQRERAEKLAAEHGCAALPSLEALLARADVEAVAICTPSGLHAAQAAAALRAGKHVLLEKPADINLEALDDLQAALEESGRKLSVVSQHRFDPASLTLKSAVERGALGRLTSASAQVRWWRAQAYYDSGGWRGTWGLDGGGALMNQSIHTVDLMLWMMGPVVEVSAYSGLLAHERIEVEDTVVAALRFASGALGTLHATTAAYPGLSARLEVSGSRGSATIDDDRLTYFHAAPEDAGEGFFNAPGGNQAEAAIEATATAGADPASLSMAHREQYRDLIAAIREDRDPAVTLPDGRRAVQLILAVYRSAREGHPVRLD
jgi:UDP-N-acetyl-2-amino-2-deoxyglucuronate dehydrogenase